MAYIGKIPGGTALTSRTLDSMTGDGSDTTLTLSQTPDSVIDVAVYYDGVMQRPGVEYTLAGNTITFTTAPANGVFICALTGGSENISSPEVDSVTTEKLVDGVVTDSKVVSVASSKLTGALPALDGSALTNVPSPFTTSTNDPSISTNPSGGIGTIWVNKTSGEMYVCTDATAGENLWTNVGPGTGDIEPWSYPGLTSGYAQGGGAASPRSNVKEKFSFISDGNSVDAGDLSVARQNTSGYSSETHGYAAGGRTNGSPTSDIIDKFAYSSDGNSTDVGNLTVSCGQASDATSSTHGYTSGGVDGASGNYICKVALASDGNATDVGDTQQGRYGPCGHSSETHGYVAGGTWTGHSSNTHIIEKFAFASNANATDVGNLSTNRGDRCSGNSSLTHGYTAGGHGGGSYTNVIDNHTFSSNANAVDVGNLTQTKLGMAGAGSLTFGYWAGGTTGSNVNVIEKTNYSSNGNATDVGDCTVSVHERAGTHV